MNPANTIRRARACAIALLIVAGTIIAQQPAGYSGLGAESVTPATIAKYAPPPLDPAVSRRIQALLDVRTPGMGAVSPDGKRLYFSWDVTGSSQVWRIDGPKSFPIQMTGGEDATGLRAITPDGKWLVLSRDVGGEENPGLYLQSADGGPLRTIQKTKGARVNLGFVQEDSKALWYTANDVKGDSYAIYSYDLATGEKNARLLGAGTLVDRRPRGRRRRAPPAAREGDRIEPGRDPRVERGRRQG